jgi:hypothetical protein
MMLAGRVSAVLPLMFSSEATSLLAFLWKEAARSRARVKSVDR